MEINEIRDKILSALGLATDGVRGIADAATDKARAGARIAKLSMDCATTREELKKTYLEIGRLYYDTHKDDPEGFFVQLFEEVRIAEEDIAAKEEEIAALKAELAAPVQPDVSVEFEDVVEQAEAAAGEVREAAADAAEEAVSEAAEDASDEAAEEAVSEAAEEATAPDDDDDDDF